MKLTYALTLFIGAFSCMAATEASQRVLPIRGEARLNAIRTTPLPPLPRQVSISPDGSRVLVVEASHKPPYKSFTISDNVDWTVWIHDVRRQKRFALPLDRATFDTVRMGDTPTPGAGPGGGKKQVQVRWSEDGGRVAFVSQASVR